jgi:NDP-sugar pyrophosphorylase family protein
VKAVILAAGKGTRLRPLTDGCPKPLLLVGGRPLLEWLLLRVREAGIEDVLVVTNYLEDMIKEKFGDGSELGVNISYVTQRETLARPTRSSRPPSGSAPRASWGSTATTSSPRAP